MVRHLNMNGEGWLLTACFGQISPVMWSLFLGYLPRNVKNRTYLNRYRLGNFIIQKKTSGQICQEDSDPSMHTTSQQNELTDEQIIIHSVSLTTVIAYSENCQAFPKRGWTWCALQYSVERTCTSEEFQTKRTESRHSGLP